MFEWTKKHLYLFSECFYNILDKIWTFYLFSFFYIITFWFVEKSEISKNETCWEKI